MSHKICFASEFVWKFLKIEMNGKVEQCPWCPFYVQTYIEMEFIEINAKKLTWSRRETCIPIEMPSRIIVTCNIEYTIFFFKYFFSFIHSYWQGLFFVPFYVLFPIPYSVCDIEHALLFTNERE